MTRHISLYVIKPVTRHDKTQYEPINLDYWVAKLLDRKLAKQNGIIEQGCGMDMGFHLVYSVSSILFHNDPRFIKTEKPNANLSQNVFERSAGYWLTQRWL
jgi:hypothetical protein